jgi:ribose transport system substrate-binding protein
MKSSKWSPLWIALLVLALVVGVSACGSSSGGESTSESSESAETTEASEEGEEGGGEEASTDYAALLEEVTQITPSKYEGPTEPVPIKAGTKVAIISCAQLLEGCANIANGAEEAAKAAGATSRTFDGQGEVSTQNKQILAAINWGAEAIILDAVDPRAVQTGLAAADEKGIVIGSVSNGIASPNPPMEPPAGDVWPAYDVGIDYTLAGEYEANWIVADSEGTANTVVYGDKEFPAANVQEEGRMKALEECEGCTTDGPIYFTVAQIAESLGEEVVSYLRTHPDVEYIMCPYDPAAPAMVTAIETAGLAEQVKLVSLIGNEQNLDYIRNGEVEAATAAYDQRYFGVASFDQAMRVLAGQEPFEPQGENTPFQLLDKENVPEAGGEFPFSAPFDYMSEFEKVWTKG